MQGGRGGRDEKGERKGGIQGVGQQPAVLSGIELVADRIPRGVDSRSIEGVEARVLSPAPIRPPIAMCHSTETSLEEAAGSIANTREDVLQGACLIHAGVRAQTSCHTRELSQDALRDEGQAEKQADRHYWSHEAQFVREMSMAMWPQIQLRPFDACFSTGVPPSNTANGTSGRYPRD